MTGTGKLKEILNSLNSGVTRQSTFQNDRGYGTIRRVLKFTPSPKLGEGRGEVKKAAFTLAEVLITLGIIGVVAAMTLPSLVQNHRKKEVETKLAKIYTVMNQATKMAEIEYGDIKEWGRLEECGVSNNISCDITQGKEIFNKYFGKHIQYSKIEDAPDNNAFYVYLNDGSILSVSTYIRDMRLFINQKALENPVPGINSFLFRFSPVTNTGQTNEAYKYHLGKGFEPYAWNWDGTIEGLKHSTKAAAPQYGCAEELGSYCTKLIQLNGWKIPDDYPLKF